jgi:hypothetical protein
VAVTVFALGLGRGAPGAAIDKGKRP